MRRNLLFSTFSRFGALLYFFLVMRKCNVESCEEKHRAKGYCSKHYFRFLKNGHTESTLKHGLTKTVEFKTWGALKNRCFNKNSPYFKDYGGRGITVCERWKNSFLAFYEDMGERPSKDHSIDRIDNNKGYCKENCRWADRTTQARNRRSSGKSGYKGVSWHKRKNKWRVVICVNYKNIWIGCYDELKDAVEARKQAEIKYWK